MFFVLSMVMKNKDAWTIMTGLFCIVLLLRLFLSSDMITFDSYETVRQVSAIHQTGKVLTYDPLSYQGRDNIVLPAFYYLLALGTLFGESLFFLIPQVLFSSVILVVFLLAKKCTSNKTALIGGLFSGFIPILYGDTLHNITPFSLALPLYLLTLYFFIESKKNVKWAYAFIISVACLAVTHSLVFVLLLSLVFYLIMQYANNQQIKRIEKEQIFLGIVFVLWITFFFFKKALLHTGEHILWSNIPFAFLRISSLPMTVSSAIFGIGVVSLIASMSYITIHIFSKKHTPLSLLISNIVVITTLLWTRMIPFKISIGLLGVLLTIILGLAYRWTEVYFKKTKFTNYWLPFIVLFLFIFGAVLPCIHATKNIVSEDIQELMEHVKRKTPQQSVVLAPVEYGHLIAAYDRKNVWDTNFLLVDSTQYYNKIATIYTTASITLAVSLMNELNVEYVILPYDNIYDTKKLAFEDESCAHTIARNKIGRLVKTTCNIHKGRTYYFQLNISNKYY